MACAPAGCLGQLGRMRSSTALLCAAALAVGGCESPPTQLVVLVDTDFSVNEELGRVRARVLDQAGSEVSSYDFALADDAAEPSPAQFPVPLSFAVVPRDGDADRRVVIEVDGMSADGDTRVQRRAVTGFLHERSLLLPMFLARSCEGVLCGAGETCVGGTCRDAAVPPGSLPVVRPGEEVRFDAGGGLDGGSDADSAPVDGGEDAGACDEEVTCGGAGCECATSCCVQACDPGECATTCKRNQTCRVEASGVASLMAECSTMSSCDVDCEGAGSCTVSCNPGAACILRCRDTEPGTCRFADCMVGDVLSCPGDVLTCRADCP